MTPKEKKLLVATRFIRRELAKDWIDPKHRGEIDIRCGECIARMLEGLLGWYEDQLTDGYKFEHKMKP